jgi:hypothetical protein
MHCDFNGKIPSCLKDFYMKIYYHSLLLNEQLFFCIKKSFLVLVVSPQNIIPYDNVEWNKE